MSVYQENGRPLSQQALYQQKLRQGVYNSPGRPIVGVNSNASDAAALLAASSDLTVKPSYERLRAAPEAHTAALLAKKESKAAWSRTLVDPMADAAALSAKAAAVVTTKPNVGIPEYNKSAVYRVATDNSTSTMTSRHSPEKSVSKHGLTTRSSSMTLDMTKIAKAADKNSSQRLQTRFNPELDYRSGLVTEYLTADEEKQAEQGAESSLTMKHGAGYTDSVAQQKRYKTMQAVDIVDLTLLAAANKAAAARLNLISLAEPADLRQQAQLYSKALAAAQRNLEERIKASKANLVDMGGGLQLPLAEVDKLAALIVQPVLADLSTKAAAKRESDAAAQSKHSELLKLHEKFKIDNYARKLREKEERKQAERDRLAAHEDRKRDEDAAFLGYQEGRHGEVDEKTQELAALEEQHAGEKEELLAEKQANEERIQEEEAELIAERKAELDAMQAERDEELKPTLDELEVETSKLKELTNTKDQLTSEVEAGEALQNEYKAKIAELKEKLEQTKTEFEECTAEHEDTVGKREATDKEVADLETEKATGAEEADKAHQELDDQIAQLEKEKEENLATKAAHKSQILLELDDKVHDEHKINEELPEHLRLSVDEAHMRDTGSLFSAETAPTTSVKPMTAVDEEPAVKNVAPAAATAAVASKPAAKPVAKPATAPVAKKGFRSRFNSIKSAFMPPVREAPAREPQVATVASTLKKDPVVETKKPVVETTKPEVAEKKKSSEVSNFDEEISIRDSRKEGGLFKEEI